MTDVIGSDQDLSAILAKLDHLLAGGAGAGLFKAIEHAAAATTDLRLKARAAVTLVHRGIYGDAVIRLLEEAGAGAAQDRAVLQAYAMALWVRDQARPDSDAALAVIRRMITLDPNRQDQYRLGAMIALSANRPFESFLMATIAFLTASAAPGKAFPGGLQRLAINLMRGQTVVDAVVDGERYQFDLDVSTTQAIESSAAHCCGLLTEIEELRYVETFCPSARVVAEVGALIGNHTAFFLRRLDPQSLHIIEANPTMVPILRRTVERNKKSNLRVAIHNCFVSSGPGEVELYAVTVPQARIDDILDEVVDFIKIDIDGGEIDALEGAERTIAYGRPRVMIESTVENRTQVVAWFSQRGYTLARQFDHGTYSNLFFHHPDGALSQCGAPLPSR